MNEPSIAVIILFWAVLIWSVPWKGYALWKAARNSQKWWFVALLVINTAAIFEIVYIFFFSKKAKPVAENVPLSPSTKGLLSFEEFKKLDIRAGKITAVEPIDGSDRLLKLTVDTGEERTIVAGISKEYSPEELGDKTILVLRNLEPRQLMGIESQGMLLAFDVGGKPVLVHPDKYVPAGSKIK